MISTKQSHVLGVEIGAEMVMAPWINFNIAPPLQAYYSSSCSDTQGAGCSFSASVVDSHWILDSRASFHMRHDVSQLQPCSASSKASSVQTANGTDLPVSVCGTLRTEIAKTNRRGLLILSYRAMDRSGGEAYYTSMPFFCC
jgi:hypothetical protein